MSPAVTIPREAQVASEQRFEKAAAADAAREGAQPAAEREPAPFAPAWLPEFAPLR